MAKGQYDMVVFTAPSGAGKTTVVRHLLKKYHKELSFSTSATTREMRPNEEEGKDYYFMSNDEFHLKIENDEFIEWEEVYTDKFYGTLRAEVDRVIASGYKVLFDIEVNGAQNIKDKFDERCLVVFVKPPSFRTLVQRLTNRGTESSQSLKDRIKRIKQELLFEDTFDIVLLNDVLEETLEKADKIIETYVLNK